MIKLKKFIVQSGFLNQFKKYMHHFVEQGVISPDQADNMIDSFEARNIRFVTAVTVIGAILIGLGILSYIASNWDYFTSTTKVLTIIISLIGFYGTGLHLEEKYNKVGKSLQYISVFIYGGGLFLIDQIYNLNLEISDHFALWIIGIIPMIWIRKDYLMYLFGQVMSVIYCFMLLENNHWSGDVKFAFMFILAAIMTALWMYMNERRYQSLVSLFVNNGLPIFLLMNLFNRLEWNIVAFTAILLAYGCYLLYNPLIGKFAPVINRVQGILIMGIAGFMFSFEGLWEEWTLIADGTSIAIVFSILFMLYLFWLTRQGNITSLVFICVFILRFYFDTFYDFLPKSVFFIIGGGILLAFGFYLERLTRKRGVISNV